VAQAEKDLVFAPEPFLTGMKWKVDGQIEMKSRFVRDLLEIEDVATHISHP